ncbi:MAG TPA: hypothetical protein VHX59_05230 [Mycobacteriales bacterium]|nr:hypothetical protein [Mycobacteriales bacterium]
MSPKRGDRVAPPAAQDEWELRFATTEAAKGWDQLCQQAASNTRQAWIELRSEPGPTPGATRHHRLKGELASSTHAGEVLPQWQYEVTGGGRIWYLLDNEKRIVWLKLACTAHPSATD